MEELYVDTDRGTIFGMATGSANAPLVVGLHGWSKRNGWHTWQPLMAPLAEAGFRVVSLDMPGWGQSQPWGPGSLTGKEAEAAVTAVMQRLAASTAVLMGKSWGGGIALNMALDQPQRVTKLILTAPAFRQIDRLAELRQPAIMAWSEDDPVIPYQYSAKFVESAPNIQLVTYPTGGHSAGPNNAEDFAVKVIDFLESTKVRGVS